MAGGLDIGTAAVQGSFESGVGERMRRSKLSLAAAVAAGVAAVAVMPAGGVLESSTVGDGTAVAAVAGIASTDGVWTAPFTPAGSRSRVIGVHSVMLHTGKVLLFGNLKPTEGYLYDPVTGTTIDTDPPADIECGAVTPLKDGRILVVGGHGSGATGINNILLFDPETAIWTAQPPSPQGRYYPTTTRLPDGRILISAGFTDNGADNTNVEVYTPPPAGSNVGTVAVVGQHRGGLYPHQTVLPDGRVLEVGDRGTSVLDPATWTWTSLPRTGSKHFSGEGEIVLPGPPSGSTKVMVSGGGNATTAVTATESYDAATPSKAWTPLAPLPQPRAHMTPVLLPDGDVLGVGGNSKGNFELPQYTALRYDPQTNTWDTLAAQVKRRGYHSSAVLLPDGRVLSAGDTGTGGGRNTLEIFSPPYLFQGARPTITAAPAQVAHDATFTISTPDPASRAVLVSPGASTHTTDMNQQNVKLKVTGGADSITAVAPSKAVAPAGWYMLFLIDSAGVPSTASWVRVG